MEVMRTRKIAAALAAGLIGCALGVASAKLPALDDAQKAKAAEAKAKADDATKKEAELLTKSQDRVADNYKRAKLQKTSGPGSAKPAK
jgi:hypothetical protein